jgi:signal peptide peptidase SppA
MSGETVEPQKIGTNTCTNEPEKPKQKSTRWELIRSCTKSKSGFCCLVCCGLICGPPFMLFSVIWEKIKNVIFYLVRKITCGKFCKEPANDKIKENAIADIENKKKKYLVYKIDNLNIDKMLDPKQYTSSNPYKDLREFTEIIYNVYEPSDLEIILKISSPGGIAFLFEELYSHLERLTKKGFVVTALVDDICASGGYMLASACSKIIVAPHAKIGSVGVICSAVNYHELTEKLGLAHKTFTTGKYKQSFPTGDKYTEEDEERMRELLNETLKVFSGMVKKARNLSDEELAVVLTAKVWNGTDAIDKKLVDSICLSTDYLHDLATSADVYVVTTETKKRGVLGSLSDLSLLSDQFEKFVQIFNQRDIKDIFKLKLE